MGGDGQRYMLDNELITELRRPQRPPSGDLYSYSKGVASLMVIMASGIACGHVRMMTATAESRKMAAILQLIDGQRHAALV